MDSLRNKKLLMFGTGAVGGYYGGMLVKAGFDVTFIARGENFEVLKNNGLTLIIDGKKESFPINVLETLHATSQQATSQQATSQHATSQHATSLEKIFDYIFICVKSKDTKQATLSIKKNISSATTVTSFQNGVENEDIIASVIGKEHVIGGLVFVASRMVSPGVIEQFGYNGSMIGELYKSEITDRIINLQKIMIESGVDCKITTDMREELWNKLVWNAAFNSISVLTGKTVDKILKENFDQLKSIMCEVRDVALAQGINIRQDTVEFNIKRSEGFTGFKTSTLQDYEQNKPIELEELVGVVVRKAKEKNITVPEVTRIYSQLREKINCTNKDLNHLQFLYI